MKIFCIIFLSFLILCSSIDLPEPYYHRNNVHGSSKSYEEIVEMMKAISSHKPNKNGRTLFTTNEDKQLPYEVAQVARTEGSNVRI